MKKRLILLIMLVFTTSLIAMAQSPVAVQVYGINGERVVCEFVQQIDSTVTLRENGQMSNYSVNDIAVVIFDNSYTDFYQDQADLQAADPYLICMKNGQVFGGNLSQLIPGRELPGQGNAGGRASRFQAADVARIYYNPRPFFSNVNVTSANSVAIHNGNQPIPPNRNNQNRNAQKKNNQNNQNTQNNQNNQQAAPLPHGKHLMVFSDGRQLIETIDGISAKSGTLYMHNKKTAIPYANLVMINFTKNKVEYAVDRNLNTYQGQITIVLRNKQVLYKTLIKFSNKSGWQFTDGSTLPTKAVARVYF
jgi:hypothetical protein